MRLNATRLRGDLYRILDRVLDTGEPAEIERRGRLLRIAPVVEPAAVERIAPHPERIIGDPDELVGIGWSAAWQPDVPRGPGKRKPATKAKGR